MYSKRLNAFINILIVAFILLLVYACARPQSPTGGPRDETPPELLVSNPQQETLFFKGDNITLEFDEFIQLKDVKSQLTITPKINDDYEYSYNKKKVFLKNLILKDSTTYTFNFGASVVDITESNPAENLIIIFSTGYFLDSLAINGNVSNILTGERIENALLGLYDINDTLDIFTGRAPYSIKSDENGIFQFTNLKNGKYILYTGEDLNNNFIIEPDKESFGFYPDTIDLRNNIDSLELFTRKRNFKPFEITSLRRSGKFFEVRLNKYASAYQLKVHDDSSQTLFAHLVEQNHNLRIYNTIGYDDSLFVHFTAYDTINQHIDSSFYIKFEDSRRKSPDFNFSIVKDAIKPNDVFEGQINFNKPIYQFFQDSIYFKYDSVTFEKIIQEENLEWNEDFTKLQISKKLDREKLPKDTSTIVPTEKTSRRVPGQSNFNPQKSQNINLYIAKSTFISIEDDTSQQITQSYNFTDAADLGIIKGSITSPYENMIIEIVDSQNEIVKSQLVSNNYLFTELKPAEYKIRVKIDLNNNKQWDLGDYKTLSPPEPIFHYNKIISVRANWEFVENIIIPSTE